MTQTEKDLFNSLEALVTRLDEIEAHPSYGSVFMISQIHGFPYNGPQWGEPLNSARELIQRLKSGNVETN